MPSLNIPLLGSVGETGELAGNDKGWKLMGEVGLGGTGGGTASFVPELERGIAGRFGGFFEGRAVPLLFPSTLGVSFSSGLYDLLLETTCVPFSCVRASLCFVLFSCRFAFSSVSGVVLGDGCLLHLTAVIKGEDRGSPPAPDVTDLNSIVSGSISRSSEDSRPEASPLQWAYDLPCCGDLGGMI